MKAWRWMLPLIALTARAQTVQSMTSGELDVLATRMHAAYANVATEADFTETTLTKTGPRVWSGHATFCNAGFVLEYVTPRGRRVSGDRSSVYVSAASGAPVAVQAADRSSYGALRIVMGDAKPTFTRGDSSAGFVVAAWSHNDARVFIGPALRVVRIQVTAGDASSSVTFARSRPASPRR